MCAPHALTESHACDKGEGKCGEHTDRGLLVGVGYSESPHGVAGVQDLVRARAADMGAGTMEADGVGIAGDREDEIGDDGEQETHCDTLHEFQPRHVSAEVRWRSTAELNSRQRYVGGMVISRCATRVKVICLRSGRRTISI